MRRLAMLFFVLGACTSSSKPSPAPAKPTLWKDMDHEQREKYMTDVVMPRSQAVFAAFDPKFKEMDCKTCHGVGATDGTFEMPSSGIKPLPNTPEAFMEWVGKDPEAARYTEFMASKVEPMMGELLQRTVFDPKTMSGELGCSTCHQLVDATGKVVPDPHIHHDDDHHHN